jgi:hypothetical protein
VLLTSKKADVRDFSISTVTTMAIGLDNALKDAVAGKRSRDKVLAWRLSAISFSTDFLTPWHDYDTFFLGDDLLASIC